MKYAVRMGAAVIACAIMVGSPASGADYFYRGKSATMAPLDQPLAASGPATIPLDVGASAQPFSVTGGSGSLSWSASGLPSGVGLSTAGTLSAGKAGDWSNLTATVTDSKGASASVTFRLIASAPPAGALYGFGQNNAVVLYPSTSANEAAPVSVNVGGADFEQVVAVYKGACGIRGGDLWCWGANGDGVLATGDASSVTTGPKRVTSVTGGWKRLFGASYQHVCGIRNAGELWCWGNNGYGQVGVPGTGANALSPKRVGTASDWTAAAPGWGHTCAIKGAGELWCWGRNAWGQYGNGGTTDSSVPVRIGTSSAWTEVAGGGEFSCGIDAGTLKCWGRNAAGELGRGTTGSSASPFWAPSPVAGDATGWSGLSVGWYHACAIKAGVAHCWGENNTGKSGAGGTAHVTSPRSVGSAGWTAVSAGYDYTCGIRGGELLCMGANQYGQSGGSGTRTGGMVAVPGTGWRTLSAGFDTTFATR